MKPFQLHTRLPKIGALVFSLLFATLKLAAQLIEKFPAPALHLLPHETISTYSEHNYQQGDLQS